MHTPKVSVLIPNYNYARFLPEAIDSVLEQEFVDFELVMVDNCSTDNSAQIMREYADRDPRIRVEFRPANTGMVANWNYCLSLARGDYAVLLLSDDKFAGPETLGKLARMLDTDRVAVMAVCARTVIDEASHLVELRDHLGRSGHHSGQGLIAKCLREDRNLIGEPSVVMMRRAAASRGFNPGYRQLVDLEMWFHLLENGDAIYTTESLSLFRQHPLQESETNRGRHVGERELLRLLADYRDRPFLNFIAPYYLLFAHLNFLKRRGYADESTLELENELRQSLGPLKFGWLSLRSRLVRPAARLRRFWRKRVLGTRV